MILMVCSTAGNASFEPALTAMSRRTPPWSRCRARRSPGNTQDVAAQSNSKAAGASRDAFVSFIVPRLCRSEHGGAFDLDLRAVFEQRLDLDERHRRVVTAHQRAPALAQLGGARKVLALVRHVDDEARHAARRAARLGDDRPDVAQRALELLHE